MVEFGSPERPGETEAGRSGSKRDSFTENKPAWGGGGGLRGRRRKKKQRKSEGGNIRQSKERETAFAAD